LPPKRWLILVQVAAWANHQPGAKAADQSAAFFLPSSLSLANALGIHIGVNLSPMDFVNFLIQLLNSVQYGLLLFMLAAGLTLIFGIMGVVNLAHGSFYMLGAYLAWSLAALTNSFTLAIVIGTLLSVLFGLLLEWLLFRHFYKRDHLDQVLLTFGLIYVFEETRSILWGDDVHGVTIPDALSASIPLTETLSYPVYRLFMSGVCLLLALGLYLLISKTRLGMKIRAGAFNHEMTEALGVNIKLIHALVFAMGVGLATIAGMVAAPVSSVYPNMGSQVLIMCFVVVVIGGIGSVKGALIAALLVGLVDTFGKVLLPQVAGMLVYVLMAIVLLYKPEGLFKN
jgi:branched-chain amino acid transport system permease protein